MKAHRADTAAGPSNSPPVSQRPCAGSPGEATALDAHRRRATAMVQAGSVLGDDYIASKEIITGQHESQLERNTQVQEVLAKLEQAPASQNQWSNNNLKALKSITATLIKASQRSSCARSGAQYGALIVYQSDDGFKIYSGANIDPHASYDFQSHEHRNCAEVQAARAAHEDGLRLKDLKYVFIYREPEQGEHIHKPHSEYAIKNFLPCADCQNTFLYSSNSHLLNGNQGAVIAVYPRELSHITPKSMVKDRTKIPQVQIAGINIKGSNTTDVRLAIFNKQKITNALTDDKKSRPGRRVTGEE